jgi:RHS repeat-associated protein
MGWDPIAVIEGGVVSFVRVDHIGRPVFATNASGVKVWTATYNPFGGVYVSTGSPPTARFPGQWFQSENGLHQNWMRDYDPTTGRYLQADPLGLVDGASVYGYVGGNPGRWMDPRGENIAGVVIGGIVSGVEWGGAVVGGAIAGAIAIIVVPTAVGDGTMPPGSIPSEAAQCTADDGRCSPAASPIWQSLLPYHGKTKTNGLPGKARRYYEWDYTHCNIEVYNKRGMHVGVKDPLTGALVGPPVPGRRITL